MGTMGKALGFGVAALAGAACFTFSTASYADAAEVLRPSTRTAFYDAGVGPGIGILGCGGGVCGSGFGFTQFQLINEIGVHLGTGAGHGPAIGGIILLGFGGPFSPIRFSPQFKFWYDIPVTKKYAIYVTPGASAGYGMLATHGLVESFFATQITCAGRLVLKDRGLVFFQPVTADIAANGSGVAFGWSIIAGGGVTFP